MLGLRTCIYKVTDLAKAKDWFASAFNTKPYFDEPFYVGFEVGGYELGLQPTEHSNPVSENVLTYWGVDDIEKAYAHLLSCGAVEHESPRNVGGEIRVATVVDPWNNVIGIIYNPSFKVS